MDKKDIYEHLANIYLDNYRERKGKAKTNRTFRFNRAFIFGSLIITVFLIISVISFQSLKSVYHKQLALIIQPSAIKMNYNFESTKKEICSFDLKSMDLSRFKAVGFSARKAYPSDVVYLKVELANSFRERSGVYIKDLSNNWHDFRIALSDFKDIRNWYKMSELSFVVEEWNVKSKKGIVYIDNVKVIQ